jgi:hypothetical protein
MPLSEQSHAYVVRIWHERRDITGARPIWRGSVNDAQGGPRVYFDTLAALCGFLARHAGLGDSWDTDPDSQDPLHPTNPPETPRGEQMNR